MGSGVPARYGPGMEPVVVHVTADGDGRGALEVRWELSGAGPVEIAVGPTPDAVDHAHPVAVVEDGASVTLHDLGPGRHYVSVAPAGGGSGVVAAERRVPLEGAANFRDLGGYRTADGGRTRWGLVFRSDALHALTVEDAALVGRLGLRVVYDLRGDHERRRHPSVELPDGDVRRVLLGIGGAAGESKEITERILDGEIPEITEEFLVGAYQQMAERDPTTFVALLTGLTDPDGLPALFHCTAGKDRTGMTAALLLRLLGVDEETVLDDYELSTAHWSEHRIALLRPSFERAGIDIERFRPLFVAPRVAMASLLSILRDAHGGVEGYLVEAGGMDPEAVAELRRLLVQPA
jgi:protein-tyrosine phosphatase